MGSTLSETLVAGHSCLWSSRGPAVFDAPWSPLSYDHLPLSLSSRGTHFSYKDIIILGYRPTCVRVASSYLQ